MSFVIAVPDLVEVAAQDLAGIRSSLDEVTEAIVAPTTSLVPAAQDEVSAAIAKLFGAFGQEYQALNAEVATFHNAFVNAMTSGAAAYLDAEIANGAALLSGGGSLTADLGAGLSGLGAALSGGLSGGLSASIGGSLGTLLGAGLGGLALQTGGALLSGVGAGLVQTGNAIVTVGTALENSGALLSSVGAQLVGQAGGALSTLLNGSLFLQLGADISLALGGNLAGLGNLAAALSGGLSGLVQTGGTLVGHLAAGVGTALNGLVQTGETVAANLAAGLGNLGWLWEPGGPVGYGHLVGAGWQPGRAGDLGGCPEWWPGWFDHRG